jgi:hypothetical protein
MPTSPVCMGLPRRSQHLQWLDNLAGWCQSGTSVCRSIQIKSYQKPPIFYGVMVQVPARSGENLVGIEAS